MGRKRKSQDNHGEAPRPSHAQRQADQARAFDEAREKMAKDPSRRNIFDEHPFDPNLDVESFEPGLITLNIYDDKKSSAAVLKLVDFAMRENSPRLTAILEKLEIMDEYRKVDYSIDYEGLGEWITYPSLPREPSTLYADAVYNVDFLPEHTAKHPHGHAISTRQFFIAIKTWFEYSASGNLLHPVEKDDVWFHLAVGQWLQAKEPFLMTLRAINPQPLSPEVNMNFVVFLFGHEKRDQKLTRANRSQPEYLVLDANLIKQDSILYNELYRPAGYVPMLSPLAPEIYNPESPYHGEREFLKSPAVYIFDFVHSVRHVIPHYDKLQLMRKSDLWHFLEDLLFYQMGDKCYVYEDDPEGKLGRRHEGSSGFPLYITNAVVVGSALGIDTYHLVGLHQAAQQKLKVESEASLKELSEDSDEDSSAENDDEAVTTDVREASEESGEKQPEEVDEDNLDTAVEEESHASLEAALETNLERAIDEVGEKVSEEIDEAALDAAFEEELETSLEAALLADAADTSTLDDDVVSNADDGANDSGADAYVEEQADPGYEGDAELNEDSESESESDEDEEEEPEAEQPTGVEEEESEVVQQTVVAKDESSESEEE
ncbi:hypothetical protein V8E51_018571 [Hyaloscypha variabilis]